MSGIDERFESLNRASTPDLWPDIQGHEPHSIVEPGPSPARRAGIIVLALAIAAGAFAFASGRFGGSSSPADETPVATNGVIYYRVGGGGAEWWAAVEPDGSGGGVVFPPDSAEHFSQISWRRDGQRIAYANNLAGAFGIATANPDGSDIEQLTHGINDVWPAWSPDGARIVFAGTGQDVEGERCTPGDAVSWMSLCPTDLYLVDADGSNLARLTDTVEPEGLPIWSPDGSRIAFVREVGRSDLRVGIYVMDADGSNQREVAIAPGGSNVHPSWSPDGTQLVYASIRYEDWGIYVTSVDGGGETPLVEGRGYVDGPVWSPDGSAIAFIGEPQLAGVEGIDTALLEMNADGTGVRLLAQAARYGVSDIAWQPLLSTTPSQQAPSYAPVPYDARVTQTIDTGVRFPSAVVAGENGVWVSAWNGVETGGELLRLDPATGHIEARIPVAHPPTWEFGGGGIAVGDGNVWLADVKSDGAGSGIAVVTRIDPKTNAVAETIDVGPGSAADLWVDGQAIWVLAFVDGGSSLRVYRLDITTHEVVAHIDLPAFWSQTIFAAGGSIWVLGTSDERGGGAVPDTLFRIDPSTNELADTMDVAEGVGRAVGSGNLAWYVGQGGLYAIDAATGSPVLGPLDVPASCCSALLSDEQGGVWILHAEGGADSAGVWHVTADGRVDARANGIQGLEQANGNAMAIDLANGSIWVTHYENTVSRIELSSP